MSEERRKYSHSSSFKMAVLFTVLLGISTSVLIYFISSYGEGRVINEHEIAISREIYGRILWLGILSIISMSLVVIISFLISTFVVKRINLIGNTAKEIIDTSDLSRRISIDTKWDDLSNLAYILNNLLGRIEDSMEDIRRVSDNIAHDLRTPLTRLKNKLEDFKNSEKSDEEVQKLIDEADHLLGTFNSLLRITNIEKGKRHSKFQDVNLKKLITDVIELYEPLIEEKKIKIFNDLDQITHSVDRDLFFQAIANILDNAIKFTPANGEISINLKQEEKITIQIIDTGIGVEESDRSKIFERFYRADESRNLPGNGLGLSLVVAVIKMHNAEIDVKNNQPNGLIVEIKIL